MTFYCQFTNDNKISIKTKPIKPSPPPHYQTSTRLWSLKWTVVKDIPKLFGKFSSMRSLRTAPGIASDCCKFGTVMLLKNSSTVREGAANLRPGFVGGEKMRRKFSPKLFRKRPDPTAPGSTECVHPPPRLNCSHPSID